MNIDMKDFDKLCQNILKESVEGMAPKTIEIYVPENLSVNYEEGEEVLSDDYSSIEGHMEEAIRNVCIDKNIPVENDEYISDLKIVVKDAHNLVAEFYAPSALVKIWDSIDDTTEIDGMLIQHVQSQFGDEEADSIDQNTYAQDEMDKLADEIEANDAIGVDDDAEYDDNF